MSLSYVKPKKKKKRLERRIKAFEQLSNKLPANARNSITKPGSMNK